VTTALPSTYQVRVRPPHDYGPGRVAECGHRVCRWHPPEQPAECWPCEYERTRRRRRVLEFMECDPSTSAPGTAGPNAASAGRAIEEGT
jgi:hypothetical protein